MNNREWDGVSYFRCLMSKKEFLTELNVKICDIIIKN